MQTRKPCGAVIGGARLVWLDGMRAERYIRRVGSSEADELAAARVGQDVLGKERRMFSTCPHCRKKLEIEDALAGQERSCPACGKNFRIPAPPQRPPQPTETGKTPASSANSPPDGPSPGATAPATPSESREPTPPILPANHEVGGAQRPAESVSRSPSAASPPAPRTVPPIPRTDSRLPGAKRPASPPPLPRATPPPLPHATGRRVATTPGTRAGAAGLGHEVLFSLFSPSIKNYGGRLGFLWGLALIVGAVLPVFRRSGALGKAGYDLYFLNIQGLWDDSLPIPKFLLLYPLLAGVGMVLLAKLTRGYVRALAMLGIGLLVWLVPADLDTRSIDRLLGDSTSGLTLVVFLMMGVFIGLRIQKGNPGTTFGRWLAGCCGAVFLFLLILPVLPKRLGTTPLVAPFRLMDTVDVPVGLLVLLMLGVLATVAVMACLTLRTNRTRDRRFASMGIRILFATMLLAPFFPAYAVFWDIYDHGLIPGIAFILVPILYVVKFEVLAYGMLAPLVIGAVDLYTVVPANWLRRARDLAGELRQAAALRAQAYEGDEVKEETPVEAPSESLSVSEPSPQSIELRAKLEQLKQLREEDLISEEDFESKKKEILDKMVSS